MASPSKIRVIPINDTTSIQYTRGVPVREGEIGTVTDNITFNLDAGASAVDGMYAGLRIEVIVGTAAGTSDWVDAYTGATKTVALDSGLAITPVAGDRYRLSPGIPSAFKTLTIGGTTGGALYYSFVNGTALNQFRRFELPVGQFRTYSVAELDSTPYIEFASEAVTDIVTLEYT